MADQQALTKQAAARDAAATMKPLTGDLSTTDIQWFQWFCCGAESYCMADYVLQILFRRPRCTLL